MTSKREVSALIKRVNAATNPYEALGVAPRAELAAIKAAHRNLARALHPDLCNVEGAASACANVNVAWDILSSEPARKRLDRLLYSGAVVCKACNGRGTVKKQKGFKGSVQVPCPACGGGGV
jgi:DnaJ-class molecular chaperone